MRIAAVLALALAISSTPAVAAATEPSPAAPRLSWEALARIPHDTSAYTQGLLLDEAGRLFESTGQWGESTVREVDPRSGRVLRMRALPDRLFGEGLAQVDDALVQLTWKAGLALRWDARTFVLEEVHRYDGQGWGLCYDGERLVMSDGSSRLTFRDPHSFELRGSVPVRFDGRPLEDLNELECVGESIWANVWRTDTIVRIDPESGQVTGWLDLAGVLDPHPAGTDSSAVLNGIAWDEAAQTLWITGKYWPEMIELRVLEPGAQDVTSSR